MARSQGLVPTYFLPTVCPLSLALATSLSYPTGILLYFPGNDKQGPQVIADGCRTISVIPSSLPRPASARMRWALSPSTVPSLSNSHTIA